MERFSYGMLVMVFLWNVGYGFSMEYTTRDGRFKEHGVKSSILPGMRWVYRDVERNTKLIIGDGRATSFYYYIWFGSISIAEALDRNDLDRAARVSDIIVAGEWNITDAHMQNFVDAGLDLTDLPRILHGPDTLLWMPDFKGKFSVHSARELIRTKYDPLEGVNLLWQQPTHTSSAAQNWKFLRGACATMDKVRSRFKYSLATKCYICQNAEESLDHILWHCNFAVRAWSWISGIFNLTPNVNLTVSYKAAKGSSRIIKELWLIANLVIRSELWFTCNKKVYEKKAPDWLFFQQRVFNFVHEYSCRLRSFMHNTVEDLRILDFFRVRHRKVRVIQPIACFWSPPERDELLLCCDGASRGNPGVAGAGVIARNADCDVLGAMSVGLGITTNFLAELYGIIVGLEWARKWNIGRILIRSDSSNVIKALRSEDLPRFAMQHWLEVRDMYDSIRFYAYIS